MPLSQKRFRLVGTPLFSTVVLGLSLLAAATCEGQRGGGGRGGGGGGAARPAAAPSAELIPVTDQLTVAKCSSCHVADAKGNLARISSIRTTPEGWEEAIKRMVRLNNLQITPDEARHVLKYLSDTHGLAPEEMAQVEYFAEHRIVDEDFPHFDVTRRTCASCHALAKPMSWRRTPEDWDLLMNMHVAFFGSGSFRGAGGARAGGGAAGAAGEGGEGGGGAAPAGRQAAAAAEGEGAAAPAAGGRAGRGGGGGAAAAAGATAAAAPTDAFEIIKEATPLITPEWSKWVAEEQTPKLAGTWAIAGEFPGKGKFFGTMKVEPKPDDEYTTHTELTFVNGSTWKGDGSSIVYTDYNWRGHTKGGAAVEGIPDANGIREVMMLSSDKKSLKGRWFWGVYQEFGFDVTMKKVASLPVIAGTDLASLKMGTTGTTVHIYGANLPTGLQPSSIDMGAGVTVTKVVSSTPSLVTVTVDVAPKTVLGPRDLEIADTAATGVFAVYDKMDYLKVLPETALAHLGSDVHPKGYALFEARAYSNGPDGKQGTKDDIDLGEVPATWKIEEFVANFGDDDINYIGKIDEKTGLFTPASDGPTGGATMRTNMRNNYGDVWTVASYTPAGASKPLVGRSYFIVSVPQYQQWDQPEVGE